jgi:hypothetical protein
MEDRAIVVKNIEVIDAVPGGGRGRSGGAPGGPDPLRTLGRVVRRVLLVAVALALAVPAVVIGGACVVTALVAALLLWGIRRLLGAGGGPTVTLTGVRRVPPGPSAP